jgi:phage N-6-adenine-methyltransferase
MTGSDFYDEHDAGEQWGTPEWIWRPLSGALGGFDLDPASGAETTPIADSRFTVEDDGLAQSWYGDVWLNPPYGRSFNRKWAEKASQEAQRDSVDTLTALVPSSTGSNWFQETYADADYMTHVSGRIQFNGAGDTSATFYNVIATWGDVTDEYIQALKEIGTVYRQV